MCVLIKINVGACGQSREQLPQKPKKNCPISLLLTYCFYPSPFQGFQLHSDLQFLIQLDNRYSDYYQNPKVARKVGRDNQEHLKLATILQTHGKSPLFPKISHSRNQLGQNSTVSPKKKIKRLRSHFKPQHDTTVTSRERTLTIDTRLETDEDRNNQSQVVNRLQLSLERPFSLGVRRDLQSNGSSLESSHNRLREASLQVKSWAIESLQDIFNQESQEEEEEEYEKEAVPGPGSYDFRYSDFDKKSKNRSTNASFLSKNTRFDYQKPQQRAQVALVESNPLKEQLQARREKRIKDRSRRMEVPFNSKSPRHFECDELVKRLGPGPMEYYPRQGMQQDLIRDIQRNIKGNFGSSEDRFVEQKCPGTYDVKNEDVVLQNENFYFKSRKERFR